MLGSSIIVFIFSFGFAASSRVHTKNVTDETSFLQVARTLSPGRNPRVMPEDLHSHVKVPIFTEEVAPPIPRHPAALMQLSSETGVSASSGVRLQMQAMSQENARLKSQLKLIQEMNDPSDIVIQTFMAFARGQFMDQQRCTREVARYFTKDAVVDFRGPKDTRFFKKYKPGYEGICEFFALAPKYYFMHDLKLEMHAKGDRIGHVWNYIPLSIEGEKHKMASGRVVQYNDVTLNEDNSKIAGFEAFYSKPHLYDELFSVEDDTQVKTSQMDKVDTIFNNYASGAYFGKQCKNISATHWTNDATVDLTGWSESEMLKVFGPGLDGVCEYFQKSYACAMNNLNVSMYARGDDVVQVQEYIPGFAGLAVSADEPVTSFGVYRFNKDQSKVRSLDILFDNPKVFDQLNAKPEAKAAVEALKNRVSAFELTRKGLKDGPSKDLPAHVELDAIAG